MKCPTCNGTGNEICSNPDHNFIEAMSGEVGRLGCPVCGHDPEHRIKDSTCFDCNGMGEVHENALPIIFLRRVVEEIENIPLDFKTNNLYELVDKIDEYLQSLDGS